jgi:sterol desaturase/sphingolipid hydroxylase (fatty acid hydroxylase superfamily)
LDLLGSAIIFILIEKALPYKKDQPSIREEWGLDMIHFTINHLLIGISLLVANNFAPTFFAWAQWSLVQDLISTLPFLLELFLCVLFADLFQYTVHRCLHAFPWLWRIHSVHHCPHFMDWLSGSRQHFIELVITRSMVLVPIFVLGFERTIIDAYVIIVGFQAVLNHTNAQINFGFLEKIIVTPQFHHWHHSSDRNAIDKNFAAHFSFIDTIFGSRVKSKEEWPKKYGITGRQLPPKYLSHLLYPFKSSFWKKDIPPK